MKHNKTLVQRGFWPVYLILLAVGAALYALLSLNTQVWADEAYTFALVEKSFSQIWKITAADVHPPLFYFLLKLLTAPFGYDLFVCRLVSALPCLILMAVAGWQLRKLFDEKTALIFMGLYLLFPYILDYATEVRMYSLAELLIMVNAIWAYRCWLWNKPGDWAVFALAGTGAAYTHYFALVSAGMVYGILLLALLLRKRQLWKGWVLASLATVLLFLPWLGSFVSQLIYKVNNEYWIEPITLTTLINYVLSVFSASGMAVAPLFFGLGYLAALAGIVISRKKEHILLALCALAVPLGTVAVGLAASILVRPVFVIRYILPSLPLAIFFFAFAVGNARRESLAAALVTVSVMAGTSNLIVEAQKALTEPDGVISSRLVSSLPEYEACVVYSGNTMHSAQELAYHDSVTPIYVPDPLGPDNPYENRVSLDTFDPDTVSKMLLVVEAGGALPEEFGEFKAEELAQVDVSGVAQTIWYLTK